MGMAMTEAQRPATGEYHYTERWNLPAHAIRWYSRTSRYA